MDDKTRNQVGKVYTGNWRFYSVALILIAPIVILILSPFTCNQHCKRLPYLFSTVLQRDTVLHKIPPFQFLSHLHLPFSQDSLRGFIHIAGFLDASNKEMTLEQMSAMKSLQEKIKVLDDIKLISYAFHTPTLKADYWEPLINKFQPISGKWYFLSPDNDSVAFHFARTAYHLDIRLDSINLNQPKVFLVDKELYIRGVYPFMEDSGKKRLLEEIDVLRCEYRERAGRYSRL